MMIVFYFLPTVTMVLKIDPLVAVRPRHFSQDIRCYFDPQNAENFQKFDNPSGGCGTHYLDSHRPWILHAIKKFSKTCNVTYTCRANLERVSYTTSITVYARGKMTDEY